MRRVFPGTDQQAVGGRIVVQRRGFQDAAAEHAVVEYDDSAAAEVAVERGMWEIPEAGDLAVVIERACGICQAVTGGAFENR